MTTLNRCGRCERARPISAHSLHALRRIVFDQIDLVKDAITLVEPAARKPLNDDVEAVASDEDPLLSLSLCSLDGDVFNETVIRAPVANSSQVSDDDFEIGEILSMDDDEDDFDINRQLDDAIDVQIRLDDDYLFGGASISGTASSNPSKLTDDDVEDCDSTSQIPHQNKADQELNKSDGAVNFEQEFATFSSKSGEVEGVSFDSTVENSDEDFDGKLNFNRRQSGLFVLPQTHPFFQGYPTKKPGTPSGELPIAEASIGMAPISNKSSPSRRSTPSSCSLDGSVIPWVSAVDVSSSALDDPNDFMAKLNVLSQQTTAISHAIDHLSYVLADFHQKLSQELPFFAQNITSETPGLQLPLSRHLEFLAAQAKSRNLQRLSFLSTFRHHCLVALHIDLKQCRIDCQSNLDHNRLIFSDALSVRSRCNDMVAKKRLLLESAEQSDVTSSAAPLGGSVIDALSTGFLSIDASLCDIETELASLSCELSYRSKDVVKSLPGSFSLIEGINEMREFRAEAILKRYLEIQHQYLQASIDDTMEAQNSMKSENSNIRLKSTETHDYCCSSVDIEGHLNETGNELIPPPDVANSSIPLVSVASTLVDVGSEPSTRAREYINSATRVKSFSVDMWHDSALRRGFEQYQSSKELIGQIGAALDALANGFESNSRSTKRSFAGSSLKGGQFAADRTVLDGFSALMGLLIVESDGQRILARACVAGAKIINTIKQDGKKLHANLFRDLDEIEKLQTCAQETADKCQLRFASCEKELLKSRQKLSKMMRSFCDPMSLNDGHIAEKSFNDQVTAYMSAYASFVNTRLEQSRADRLLHIMQLKKDSCNAIYRQLLQDAWSRHESGVARVLSMLQEALLARSETTRSARLKFEESALAIDTQHDLDDFCRSITGGTSAQWSDLDHSTWEAARSRTQRYIRGMSHLVRVLHDASGYDETLVKGLRRSSPFDLSMGGALDQAQTYAPNLTSSLLGLKRSVDCILTSLDERSSRLKEVASSLRRQKRVLKSNLIDLQTANKSLMKKVSQLDGLHRIALSNHRKSMAELDKRTTAHDENCRRGSNQHEQSPFSSGSGRRQSFIHSLIPASLKSSSNLRSKMDNAMQSCNVTRQSLEDVAMQFEQARRNMIQTVSLQLQSLYSLNTTRITSIAWALLAYSEQYSFCWQQQCDNMQLLSSSIDRLKSDSDRCQFIRSANRPGNKEVLPPEHVILSQIDRDRLSTIMSFAMPQALWEATTNFTRAGSSTDQRSQYQHHSNSFGSISQSVRCEEESEIEYSRDDDEESVCG